MDIPAIHLVKTDDVEDTSPLMMDAVEMYLSIKGKDDRMFILAARRNGEYVSKVLGNRPITSYSSSEAAQFRDWCFEQGMNINTVKRVFGSVRAIINLTMRDRLRAVSCPSEMIDQIGGWSKRSVGEGYREGFEVGQLHAHLSDIV